MSSIFLSYRREDSADVSGRITDRLTDHFGREAIFTDVDSIPMGVDFKRYIDEQVGNCQILLAVIGRDWISASNADGSPRIEDPADFVRIEIESALKRSIPVIPLLVRGATMPLVDDLPESLNELAFRNGMKIRPNPDFHRDMDRLIRGLEEDLAVEADAAAHREVGEQARQRTDATASVELETEQRTLPRAGATRAAEDERGVAAGRAGGLKAGEETPDQRRAGERARAPTEAKQGLTSEQLSSGFVALYIIVGVGGALLLSALLIAIQQDWNMWLGVSIPAMTFGAIGLAFLRRSPEGGVVLLIACTILGIVIFGLAPG